MSTTLTEQTNNEKPAAKKSDRKRKDRKNYKRAFDTLVLHCEIMREVIKSIAPIDDSFVNGQLKAIESILQKASTL